MVFSVFNDGARKELVNLSGTIPVVYKSMQLYLLLFYGNDLINCINLFKML